MNYIEEFFNKLRHTKSHHLGLGDIRLTVAQQDEIVGITNEMNTQADMMIEKIEYLVQALQEIDELLLGDLPITRQAKRIAQEAIRKAEGEDK